MMRTFRTTAVAALSAVGLLAVAMPAANATTPTVSTPAAVVRTSSPTLAPTAVSDPVVRVATYNVCKTTCGKGKYRYANRRLALVRIVDDVHPDVLAVQEANTQVWHGTRQIDDVVNLMGSIGYRITSTNYTCTEGCTRGAHIFYNPSRMHIASLPNPSVAVGMTGLSVIAQTPFGGVQDRAASWAFLSRNGSSKATLYVSVHLPTEKTAFSESLRVAIAAKLRGWADGLIRASGLPSATLVVAGDFNSYDRRQPLGAQTVLASSATLIDGYSAPVRINDHFGTINVTPQIKKYKGFPPKPYYYRTTDPARIDYIFSSVAPLRWEVVLRLQANGKFDNAYRASDHNMVLVDLPLA